MKLEKALLRGPTDVQKSWDASFSIEEGDEDRRHLSNSLKGVLIMVVAAISFGIMGFMIKLTYENNPHLKAGDVLLFRSFLMLPAFYAYAKISRVNLLDIKVSNVKLLFLRCFFGAISMALLFLSINFLPTSIAFMIFNINPIFVALLAYFLLQEKLTQLNIICVIGAFLGVVLVGFGRSDKKIEGKREIIGIIICFVSSLTASFAYICMKKLNQEMHYIFSPYYLCVASLVLIIPIYVFDTGLIHLHYTFKDISYMFTVGVFALGGQLLLSLAYKYANASTVSPLMYINCLLNLFFDLFYFKFEFFYTDAFGAIVITGCIGLPVIMLFREHSSNK